MIDDYLKAWEHLEKLDGGLEANGPKFNYTRIALGVSSAFAMFGVIFYQLYGLKRRLAASRDQREAYKMGEFETRSL